MNHQNTTVSTSRSRLALILEKYLADLETGSAPDKDALLAAHPELAEELQACLASLDFMRRVDVGTTPTATPETAGTGKALGDFRIVREIGRGGMGIVYEAEQLSLGRRVALKVLPFAAVLDPVQLQRFKNEAQAAAQLHHTNIVPVFGVGCERGVHYYAMQYIEGHTLTEVIHDLRFAEPEAGTPDDSRAADTPESAVVARGSSGAAAMLTSAGSTKSPAYFRSVAELGVQAAEALEHGHELGVVHRDGRQHAPNGVHGFGSQLRPSP